MLETVPTAILENVQARHAEPQRHYHDWTHVEALLRHAASVRDSLNDTDAVLYAILFHDAVYDPKAGDNEQRSAALLVDTQPPMDAGSLMLARRMIEATDGHMLPADLQDGQRADCALFLDMDLAILGASAQRFDIYEEQIRREYSHVPDADFRKGRAAVLRHFADRDTLYFSDWGIARFEANARTNLARSLALLAG